MILTGNKIIESVEQNLITIEPFDLGQVNPNSYDLRLGNKLLIYKDEILDPRKNNEFIELTIPPEGLILKKGEFYLGHSHEVVGTDKYVPIIHCKSGIARLGLFIHITADLIDIGSKVNYTFQMYPTLNLKIYPNMKIAQVSFWKVYGEIDLYKGKYQDSRGPMASKSYKDFSN